MALRPVPFGQPWKGEQRAYMVPHMAATVQSWIEATRYVKEGHLLEYAWQQQFPIQASIAANVWKGTPGELIVEVTSTVRQTEATREATWAMWNTKAQEDGCRLPPGLLGPWDSDTT
jgi:hypothetical protein